MAAHTSVCSKHMIYSITKTMLWLLLVTFQCSDSRIAQWMATTGSHTKTFLQSYIIALLEAFCSSFSIYQWNSAKAHKGISTYTIKLWLRHHDWNDFQFWLGFHVVISNHVQTCMTWNYQNVCILCRCAYNRYQAPSCRHLEPGYKANHCLAAYFLHLLLFF